MTSDIMQRISVYRLEIELLPSKENLLLTPIFEATPYIVIETKGTLIKAKEENSERVVTRNISYFRRIPKDAVFPNNTSDESDDDF